MSNVGEPKEVGAFRSTLNQLHTWLGVTIGALLFAIFWMGTLSVFDSEIDRWTMPETRLTYRGTPSLDSLQGVMERLGKGADQLILTLPSERTPVLTMRVIDATRGMDIKHRFDPATGRVLSDPGTLGGTGFFMPFHFRLHLTFMDLGYWIVGFAGMAMLVLCLSGIIVHKRRFADFFTLRISQQTKGTTRDLHTLFGMLGLPFNLVIALSGLIMLMPIYFHAPITTLYRGEPAAFEEELAADQCSGQRAGQTAGTLSLDSIMAKAAKHWGGSPPRALVLAHPGNANGYIVARPSRDRDVSLLRDTLCFDATTGDLKPRITPFRPIQAAEQFLTGMHVIQYSHWPLRWLYFLSGLAGCGLIATGLLYWAQSRLKQQAKRGLAGARLLNGVAAAATMGLVVATLAFLQANRILPSSTAQRAEVEVWIFSVAWFACLAHALLRPDKAWNEQCLIVALGAIGAVALNAATTGDNPLTAAMRGQGGVAGVDMVLLLGALIALFAWRKISARQQPYGVRAVPLGAGHG